MKMILAVLTLFLATACSADRKPSTEPVKPVEIVQPVDQVKEEPTKAEAPVAKKVCINAWDAKLNKEVQKCKTMKIHKKHEGTEVPPAKGAK